MNSTQLITESHEHQKGKVCNKCKEHLPLSEFYNCTRIKDGKGGTCKICVNDYQSNRPEFTRWYITKKKDGKRDGHEWSIGPEDIPGVKIREVITEARGRKYKSWEATEYPKVCPVLRVELDWGMNGRQPNSPSLDRIDSTKGYVKGNVMMMGDLANIMKNNATPEQLNQFSRYHLFGDNK